MKIIYLHQYFKFPNESGGTRSYDLSKSFVDNGYTVTVVTSTSDVKFSKKRWSCIQQDGIIVYYLYLPYGNHLSYIKRILVFLKFLWFASFRILKLKGDFVIATSTPLTIGIPALINKWFSNTPFVFEVRDVWPEAVIAIGAIKNKLLQKLLYFLEKLIYKNAYAIVPLSLDMQKSIITRYPNLKNKTNTVIENIAELNRFQNDYDAVKLEDILGFEPRFSVLYAGTFGKVNGIHKFVELAEKTLKIDNKLVYILIGSGAEKDSVVRLAQEKKILNRNLFILDSVSKSDLPIWYKAVSMGSSFVIDIKELWANSANKFFDTLAAGKPILINHEGWQAETIRNRKVGFVLSFNITDEVAKDFVDYTKNETLIKLNQEMALKLAKEKYSLEIATKKYLKVFNKI